MERSPRDDIPVTLAKLSGEQLMTDADLVLQVVGPFGNHDFDLIARSDVEARALKHGRIGGESERFVTALHRNLHTEHTLDARGDDAREFVGPVPVGIARGTALVGTAHVDQRGLLGQVFRTRKSSCADDCRQQYNQ